LVENCRSELTSPLFGAPFHLGEIPTGSPQMTALVVTPSEFRRDLWRHKTRFPEPSYDVVCVFLRLAVWYNTGV